MRMKKGSAECGAFSSRFICVDAGYTFTRMALWDGTRLSELRRWRTPNKRETGMLGKPADEVRANWRTSLEAEIKQMIRAGPAVQGVGIALAGMVSRQGKIAEINSIWGRAKTELWAKDIEESINCPVVVVNDLTAASFRYGAESTTFNEKIVVVSISSGIGCKTYCGEMGDVVLDEGGRIGEIGLALVDHEPTALGNDNGSLKGILGNYSSGTAFRRILLYLSRQTDHAESYKSSFIGRALKERGLSLEQVDRHELNLLAVQGLACSDPFILEGLRFSAAHLARVLQVIILYDAPSQIIICGGFARAFGEAYRRILVDALTPMLNLIYSAKELERTIILGHDDDEDVLIGIGQMCMRRLSE